MEIIPKKKMPCEQQKFHCYDHPDKSYKTKCGLRQHVDVVHHNKKSFKCTNENCDKLFSSSTKQKQHLKTHDQVKDFTCGYDDDCGKKFRTKDNVKSHLESVHLNLRPFFCNLCGESFKKNRNLKQHATLHERTALKCEYCDKVFVTKRKLQRHQKFAHQKRRCIVCEKDLQEGHQVRNHLKNKSHRDAAIQFQINNPGVEVVNNFIIAV